MADVHTPAQRSRNMAAIHSQNTLPEEIVRKYLFSRGLRYRKNDPRLPGKPDIVFPKYNTFVFVNGCFWHAHTNCRYFVWPKNNESFWKKKITRNVERDNQNISELKTKGWHVIIVWECELRGKEKAEGLRTMAFLQGLWVEEANIVLAMFAEDAISRKNYLESPSRRHYGSPYMDPRDPPYTRQMVYFLPSR